MSTTSTNFSFVLATTSDTVNVAVHVADNFSTLDSLIGIVHTGTGQLKTGLALTSPTLLNPVLTGTMTGGTIVATTARFQTITATGGALTVNSLTVGTYSYPATIGSSAQVLTVVTGHAVFASNLDTGANTALSNLAAVAINTNLNTFTAGLVTVAHVIATSGSLTGLTVFQATTGTFAGALLAQAGITVTGTVAASVVNCTGGAITATSLSVGTYAYPATVGTTGSFLTVTTGNVVFSTAAYLAKTAAAHYFLGANAPDNILALTGTLYDGGGISLSGTAITIASSGYYIIAAHLTFSALAQTSPHAVLVDVATTASSVALGYGLYNTAVASAAFAVSGAILYRAPTGEKIRFTNVSQATMQSGTYGTFITIHRLPEA